MSEGNSHQFDERDGRGHDASQTSEGEFLHIQDTSCHSRRLDRLAGNYLAFVEFASIRLRLAARYASTL